MIKFTVYKILNLITNEYYIGVHKTSNVKVLLTGEISDELFGYM